DAAPRSTRRVVDWPGDALGRFQVRVDVTVLEGMVAAADDVDPAIEELVRVFRGEAAATRGVLAVRDHVIKPELSAQFGYGTDHGLAAAVADNVAEEEKSHSTLARILRGARLADDRDLDLARVLHRLFDLLAHVAGDAHSLE